MTTLFNYIGNWGTLALTYMFLDKIEFDKWNSFLAGFSLSLSLNWY